MIQTVSGALEKFQNSVGIRFQLYNSLFLSLPFYGVDKTGIQAKQHRQAKIVPVASVLTSVTQHVIL